MILMRRGQLLSWAHDMLDASRSTTGTVLLHTSHTAHFLLGSMDIAQANQTLMLAVKKGLLKSILF